MKVTVKGEAQFRYHRKRRHGRRKDFFQGKQ